MECRIHVERVGKYVGKCSKTFKFMSKTWKIHIKCLEALILHIKMYRWEMYRGVFKHL